MTLIRNTAQEITNCLTKLFNTDFGADLYNLDDAENLCNNMERDKDTAELPSVKVLREGIKIKQEDILKKLKSYREE